MYEGLGEWIKLMVMGLGGSGAILTMGLVIALFN